MADLNKGNGRQPGVHIDPRYCAMDLAGNFYFRVAVTRIAKDIKDALEMLRKIADVGTVATVLNWMYGRNLPSKKASMNIIKNFAPEQLYLYANGRGEATKLKVKMLYHADLSAKHAALAESIKKRLGGTPVSE